MVWFSKIWWRLRTKTRFRPKCERKVKIFRCLDKSQFFNLMVIFVSQEALLVDNSLFFIDTSL